MMQSLAMNRTRAAMIVLALSLGPFLLALTLSLRSGVNHRVSALMELFFRPNQGGIGYLALDAKTGKCPVSDSQRMNDLRSLEAEMSGKALFAGVIQDEASVSHAGKKLSLLVTAAKPSFFAMKGWTIKEGSALGQEDEKALHRVCLLTADTAEKLYGKGPCIGAELEINGVLFHVKGLRPASQGVSSLSSRAAQQVLIPFTTGMRRLWHREGPEVIQFEVRSNCRLSDVVHAMQAFLRKSHGIQPGEPDDFRISTGAGLTEKYRRGKQAVLLSTAALSLFSFLLGTAVAVNSLLLSLKQRGSEFALKRALGASRMDLLREVTFESVALATLGCLVSLILGVLILTFWREFASPSLVKRYPFDVSWATFVVPCAANLLIGLLVGVLVGKRLSVLNSASDLRDAP